MEVRNWDNSDAAKVADLHDKMGMEYRLPDFGPLFAIKRVVTDENGAIIAAGALKLISEGYLWLDPKRTGYERSKAVILLNRDMTDRARELGLEDISCWIPTRMIRCFRRTLERLGWRRSPWRTYSRCL